MIGRLTIVSLVTLVALGAVPTATTRGSTSSLADDAPAGSLAAMLDLLPRLELGGEAGATVTYVDVATQLATVGVAPPRSLDEATTGWVQATGWLKRLQWMGHSYDPGWREMFGFGMFEIDQAIEYEARPLYLTIYRGRFNRAAVLDSWQREGYRAVDVNGTTIYEDLDLQLKRSGVILLLSNMHFAAVLDDQTVAFSFERDTLAAALAATAGRKPSLAEAAGVVPLLTQLPANLVSAMVVDGAMLKIPPQKPPAPVAAVGPMPPVIAALLGITAGVPLAEPIGPPIELPPGVPAARPLVALSFAERDDAVRAAETIAKRLATGRMPDDSPAGGLEDRPFAELFPHVLVRPAAEESAVLIAFGLAGDLSPDILYRMLDWENLTFVAWSP